MCKIIQFVQKCKENSPVCCISLTNHDESGDQDLQANWMFIIPPSSSKDVLKLRDNFLNQKSPNLIQSTLTIYVASTGFCQYTQKVVCYQQFCCSCLYNWAIIWYFMAFDSQRNSLCFSRMFLITLSTSELASIRTSMTSCSSQMSSVSIVFTAHSRLKSYSFPYSSSEMSTSMMWPTCSASTPAQAWGSGDCDHHHNNDSWCLSGQTTESRCQLCPSVSFYSLTQQE